MSDGEKKCLVVLGMVLVFLIVGVILSITTWFYSTSTESPVTYKFPNPRVEYTKCGLKNSSSVCDPDRSMKPGQVGALNEIIQSFNSANACACERCPSDLHHSLMVAVVPAIQVPAGGSPKTAKEEKWVVKMFAESLRDKTWKLPEVACSIRVYIVHDLRTKRVWTATDKWARKVISDEASAQAARNAKVYLTNQLVYSGLRQMVLTYTHLLEAGPLKKTAATKSSLAWWLILIIVIISLGSAGIFCCIIYECCCTSGSGGGGRHKRGYHSSTGGGDADWDTGDGHSDCGGGGGGD